MKSKSTRDTIVLCLIVFGSLAISGGLGTWLVRGLILERGPRFLRPGPTHGYHAATFWKGELWYYNYTLAEPGRIRTSHIQRRVLETGEDRESNLALPNESNVYFAATADRLWIIGNQVYETDGQSILQTSPALPPAPPGPSGMQTLICNYFLLDGVLSSIREYQPECYRIVQLVDGQWLDGLEVILPGLNRRWLDDERQQRKVLAPRTCDNSQPSGTSASRLEITVIPDHRRLHLVAIDGNFMAYRAGFESLEIANESASALIPANAPPEASGWEYVADKSFWPFYSAAAFRGAPVIVAFEADLQDSNNMGPCRVWMRMVRDRFDAIGDVIPRIPQQQPPYPILVSSPNHDVCYLLSQHEMQGTEVFAVEETGLRKLPRDLPGYEWPMIAWFVRLGIAIGAAWLTHLVLLVIGMGWFQSYQDRVIVSGNGSATLGSIPRRAVARGIDLALVLSPMILQVVLLMGTADPVDVSHELWQQESKVTGIPDNNWRTNYQFLIRNNWRYPALVYSTMQWSLFGSMIVWFMLVALEGAYGVTPGKWLCGLRTMRTTLRPCGLARVILRDVLLCVDLVLLLTPIPAVVGCFLSPHRQRWGDRVADTVVVEARSLRTRSTGDAVDSQAACIQISSMVG